MLTIDDFAPRAGETFTATAAEGRTLALSLAEVEAYQGSSTRYSLVFVHPGADHVPQQILAFDHAELGRFDLFVVPIGPGPDGMRYEAIINT